jgi:peptide/nickel transport system permease protein
VYIRLTRANMIDILKSDFILAARARGIPENKVVYKHALKNAFIPILTMMGLQFAMLIGGAILTETTFSWPGMGRLLLERIYLRDYPTIQGIIVVFALGISMISLIVDIIYALVDPRIKY